ncbi:hypothetical protein HY612_00830 [Candidatus Roizmanbacteria bacterium]|nr:hypothetical protein [Candidatus Roizmanbacteria bacterium]
MEKDVVSYIRKHTFLLTVIVVVAFLLLAFGEYFLYRKTQELNKMVSEGLMQIKEELITEDQMSKEVMMQDGRMMLEKDGFLLMMGEDTMLPNGMKVMMDGTIVKPDGTKDKLKEGQRMNMEGMILP